MSQYTAFIVGGGVAVVVISGSIIGGIIANELNEGDNHKVKMTSSPPPPPPVSRMRAMTEHQEIYGKPGSHFDLTKDEHKIFATLARRQMSNGGKLHR